MNAKDILIEGCKTLDAVLLRENFKFHLKDEGRGSGGEYVWGEYVRGDRCLEIHFRGSLGLVRYHVGPYNVSHEAYMKQLGVWPKCQYPGFSSDPLHAFGGLGHDLHYAENFLSGDSSVLMMAAKVEAESRKQETVRLMDGYVGDTRRIEHIRVLFRQGRYDRVISQFKLLKYPKHLKPSELRMIEIARKNKSS